MYVLEKVHETQKRKCSFHILQCEACQWTRNEQKLEILGSIVSCLVSPIKILGENFFEHSGWHKTSRNA